MYLYTCISASINLLTRGYSSVVSIGNHTDALEKNILVVASFHGQQLITKPYQIFGLPLCSFHVGGFLNTGPSTHRGDGTVDDGEYTILQ